MREIKIRSEAWFSPIELDRIYTQCNNCPCLLHWKGEWKCGLGFDVKSGWSDDQDEDLVIAPNCLIAHIRYQKKEKLSHHLFIPEQIKLIGG